MNRQTDYPLGYSPEESQRLAEQAALVSKFTSDTLQRAGLAPGMDVLDIGCGVGDVAMLAAEIVGEAGSVLGIDRAASSVETARQRAMEKQFANLSFVSAELAEFESDRRFDAIIGRFVLSYVPGRAAILERLTRYLRSGGIVVMQEIDMTHIGQEPASKLFVQARRWLLDAFAATGAELEMGTNLHATFIEAGLPEPRTIAVVPVVGGPECGGYDQMVQTLHSVMPVIEREEIAKSEEIGIETLGQRLRDDAITHDRSLTMSRIVAAWSQNC